MNIANSQGELVTGIKKNIFLAPLEKGKMNVMTIEREEKVEREERREDQET